MENALQQLPFDGKRIVLYGPESTGKTTLAKELARHFSTGWVPEFARDYLQQKWDTTQTVCSLEDLPIIVKGQLDLENSLVPQAQRFLFCDTNVLVTQIWSQTHFEGYCAPEIMHAVDVLEYDFYLLTDIDVPWEKDDLRDRPQQRNTMLDFFEKELIRRNLPYQKLTGPHQERFLKTVSLLEKIFPKIK